MNKQCTQPAPNASLDSTSVAGGCSKTFQIDDKDQEFYNRIDVPEPTLCPDCRYQRRLTWRNLRKLYKCKCDLCKKEMIGIYSADKPYKVYCNDCYWSDKWSGLEYGRDFDFARPFMEQFNELLLDAPHMGTSNQESENSNYTNFGYKNKNCYLCFGTDVSEDCYYCTKCFKCTNTFDSYNCGELELCSWCLDCYRCFNTHYSQECENLRDSYFNFDCKNSSNIFGCAGLRNKEYYIFNKAVDKEKWHQQVEALLASNTVPELYKMAEKSWLTTPHKWSNLIKSEASTGDHLRNTRNAIQCYDCGEIENCKYVIHSIPTLKDCMDVNDTGAGGELMYESTTGYGYNIHFSATCYSGVSDLDYCYQVTGSKNCFGSVGLQKEQYVILNKKYSPAEYETLRTNIIQYMKKTGEYGEFFSTDISPFAYNETEAQQHYPLSKNDAKSKGLNWKDDTDLPMDKNLLTCIGCKGNFKIVKQEQEFLNKQGLPSPTMCPECRFNVLQKMRNPYELWHRQCMCTQPDHDHKGRPTDNAWRSHAGRCSIEFETTYSSDRKEIIYCETCYQKEIY
ncbi:MAG: hypothetical protein Q8P90_06185 [bacterium]|nr:hypothetical protein [bacterium]